MFRRTARTSAALAGASILCLLLATGCSPAETETAKQYKGLSPSFRLDQSKLIVECVKEKGFTVKSDVQGGVGYTSDEVPDDQIDLVNAAIKTCYADSGFGDDSLAEITDEQLHKLYALNLEAAKCLESLDIFGDIKVQVAEAPSEQSFVDTFRAPGDAPPWSPWGSDTLKQISSVDKDTVEKARLNCPDPLNYVYQL